MNTYFHSTVFHLWINEHFNRSGGQRRGRGGEEGCGDHQQSRRRRRRFGLSLCGAHGDWAGVLRPRDLKLSVAFCGLWSCGGTQISETNNGHRLHGRLDLGL